MTSFRPHLKIRNPIQSHLSRSRDEITPNRSSVLLRHLISSRRLTFSRITDPSPRPETIRTANFFADLALLKPPAATHRCEKRGRFRLVRKQIIYALGYRKMGRGQERMPLLSDSIIPVHMCLGESGWQSSAGNVLHGKRQQRKKQKRDQT